MSVHGFRMQLLDVPLQDRVVAAAGATSSALLATDYIDSVLALIIAALTAILLLIRIVLAFRELKSERKTNERGGGL